MAFSHDGGSTPDVRAAHRTDLEPAKAWVAQVAPGRQRRRVTSVRSCSQLLDTDGRAPTARRWITRIPDDSLRADAVHPAPPRTGERLSRSRAAYALQAGHHVRRRELGDYVKGCLIPHDLGALLTRRQRS